MSKTTNNGGPAFPVRGFDDPQIRDSSAGMTLRDYFAAAALQGILARYSSVVEIEFDRGNKKPIKYLAKFAGIIADTMIEERRQQ